MHCFVYLSFELLNNLEWDFAVFKFTSLSNSFKAFSRFIAIRSVPGTGRMVWFPGGHIWPCILASPSLPEQVCTLALGFLRWLPCPDGLLHVCFILVSLVEARNSLSMTLSSTQTPVWAMCHYFLVCQLHLETLFMNHRHIWKKVYFPSLPKQISQLLWNHQIECLRKCVELSMVCQVCNLRTWQAKAGRLLKILNHFRL